MSRTDTQQKAVSSRLIVALAATAPATQSALAFPDVYSALVLGASVLYGLSLVVLLLRYNMPRSRSITLWLAALWVTLISGLVASIATSGMTTPYRAMIVPLLGLLIGSAIPWTRPMLDRFIVVYASVAAGSGWAVLLIHGETPGFDLAERNQLGFSLASAAALLIFFLWDRVVRRHDGLYKHIPTVLLLYALISALLATGSRSGPAGVLLFFLALTLKTVWDSHTRMPLRIFVLLATLSIVFISRAAIAKWVATFFLRDDVSGDLNTISSNRIDGYRAGIEFLRQHLFFGEVTGDVIQSNPHMFVLYQLTIYGLLISFPSLILYFHYVYMASVMWVRSGTPEMKAWIAPMTVALTTSVVEYTPPFGPGTVQLAMWIMIGASQQYGPQSQAIDHYPRPSGVRGGESPAPLAASLTRPRG